MILKIGYVTDDMQTRDLGRRQRVQSRGNLNNGGKAGLAYANLNNGLSNANWNYAARITGIQQETEAILTCDLFRPP